MSPSAQPGPPKRTILEDSDSDSDGEALTQGEGEAFKVNEAYARRFHHNKEREEREKLEKKYGKADDSSSSESEETEDEDGFLATEALDAQISATLKAIRTKDPRVYDKNVTFIELPDDEEEEEAVRGKGKKEKPVYLHDYQREKLLRGDADGEEKKVPPTYMEEQDALKKSILSGIHASGADEESDSSDDDDGGFLKRKESDGIHPSRRPNVKKTVGEMDVASADKDPEKFLSNFMASRAWIPEEGTKWKVFESDDGESDADEAAEEWEHAYNMRFEDPSKSNEVLRSYARDFAAARSVRRQEKTGRQRQREAEREKKEHESRKKAEEKARLRKLKLEESAEKLRKVKQAAGAVGKKVKEEDWMRFLDEEWENDKWEEEMQRRFGEEYYALDDVEEEEEADDDAKKKRSRAKKPKWDDDIDIKDIVPEFADDNEDDDDDDDDGDDDGEKRSRKRRKTTKLAPEERTRLASLVDTKLLHDPSTTTTTTTTFRYRETSPQAFGMTALDILLAPTDQSLNKFASLKKLAPFRDAHKKSRDGKSLAKRARLRQWRRDVFGHAHAPFIPEEKGGAEAAEKMREGEVKKEKKRRRKKKKEKTMMMMEDEEDVEAEE
ncbi:hypothetical protein L249_8786 [Ophiocordyceps polyrhachis-furcata BCC 54312]|uniref:Kri1-like C-terminal domain-containing protein n=1 Tax=Ophiocordyceps polyrhachis-furcata BCC 54312 TaxID=1330021 RepID=A0A367L2P9_9HYPO|nr:hypothetical protein L249_8786 [Ophiocordyceps polyrhachis-furcata BCC 54312]